MYFTYGRNMYLTSKFSIQLQLKFIYFYVQKMNTKTNSHNYEEGMDELTGRPEKPYLDKPLNKICCNKNQIWPNMQGQKTSEQAPMFFPKNF